MLFTFTQATQPGIISTGHQYTTGLGHYSPALPQELPETL